MHPAIFPPFFRQISTQWKIIHSKNREKNLLFGGKKMYLGTNPFFDEAAVEKYLNLLDSIRTVPCLLCQQNRAFYPNHANELSLRHISFRDAGFIFNAVVLEAWPPENKLISDIGECPCRKQWRSWLSGSYNGPMC